MKSKPEIKIEQERYYTVVSGRTNLGEKLVAEYDDRNHNLRIYVYEGDVVKEAYYDDDEDGKVETYFANGVRHKKEALLRNSGLFDVLLSKLLGTEVNSRKSVKGFFKEKDYYFRKFKRELNVANVIASQKLLNDSIALEEILQ